MAICPGQPGWTAGVGAVAGRRDCWVFDVDGCLVDSLTGTSLRPGARDIVMHLAARRPRVLLWSAGGGEYAAGSCRAVRSRSPLQMAIYPKDGRDGDGLLLDVASPVAPGRTVFVDDRPEDLRRDLEVLVGVALPERRPPRPGARGRGARAPDSSRSPPAPKPCSRVYKPKPLRTRSGRARPPAPTGAPWRRRWLRPEKASQAVRKRPMRRGRLTVPPAPGTRPRPISGSAICVSRPPPRCR